MSNGISSQRYGTMGTLGQALGWKGNRFILKEGQGQGWRTTAVSLGFTSLCIHALSPPGCVGELSVCCGFVCTCGDAYVFLP